MFTASTLPEAADSSCPRSVVGPKFCFGAGDDHPDAVVEGATVALAATLPESREEGGLVTPGECGPQRGDGGRGILPRRELRGRLVPRQVDDTLAIRALGDRLDAYRGIEVPVLLLGGDKSPDHLARRLDSLDAVIPRAERVTMAGQGHSAHASAPAELARIVDAFARSAFEAKK
jgi:pimeloyl-ACP methyl ester carboxylesterase